MKKLLFLTFALNFINAFGFSEADIEKAIAESIKSAELEKKKWIPDEHTEINLLLCKLSRFKKEDEIESYILNYISQGGDLNLKTDYLKGTLLHDFVRQYTHGNRWLDDQNIYANIKALIKHGANPDILDFEGRTPLHLALERDADDIARILIDKTKNINTQDEKNGYTPLRYAAKFRDLFIKFLDRNVDVNVEDKEGNNPIGGHSWASDKEIPGKIEKVKKENKISIETSLTQATPLPKVLTDLIIDYSFSV